MKLTEVRPGLHVRIESIDGDVRLLTRLSSMGMAPGASVKVVRNDRHRPVLVFGRDTLLALGRRDAARVEVIL